MLAAIRSENDQTKYIFYERWKDPGEFWQVQMKKDDRLPYNQHIAVFKAADRKVTM
ncbi:hypothetical protein [Dyadobacter luteus]|uniref:hypothetical protein n=1 Tax=Dyadobacter luteus TaxID=2259619 RepID=UPI0018F73F3D|nr:hypothetical protein [Dyadobacter luteus]